MKRTALMTFAMVCLLAGIVHGSVQPVVRAALSAQEVSIGSEVTLTITVLVPTWFSKPPVYPAMEIQGLVTELPPDSTYPMSEVRDGDNWSGLIREYKFYPLEDRTFNLGEKRIKLTYADPETRQPLKTEVSLPSLEFSAVKPVGAENLEPFLSGSSLDLIQEVSHESEIYRPGDSVERLITLRFEGMPSLFLPPLLSVNEIPGISIYPGTPKTDDERKENDQTVTGIRSEVMTYVFERGGTFEFPAVTLRWWNTGTNQIEITSIPPLVFEVKKTYTQKIKELPFFVLSAIVLIILMLTVSVLYFRKSIMQSLVDIRKRFYHSEAYMFTRLLLIVEFSSPKAAYSGILAWLRKFGNDSVREGGTIKMSTLLTLEKSIYGPGTQKNSFGLFFRGKLVSQLVRIRRRIQENKSLTDTGAVSLNPN